MTPTTIVTAQGRRAQGFSLIETIVALSVLVAVVLGVAQLFTFATRGNDSARMTTFTSVLATEQLDRLRSLAWGFDESGLRRSDITTDLSVSPETSGGVGLWPSPSDSLQRNVNGYSDFTDRAGRSLAPGGGAPPPGAAYVRRWSIEPLAAHPLDGLVLRVRVLPIGAARATSRVAVGEGRLMSVLARKAR